MKHVLLTSVFVTVLLLSACTSTPEPNPSTREIRQLGVVHVATLRTETEGDAVAGAGGLFFLVEKTLEDLEVISDSCFVERPDGPAEPNILEQYPDPLDAGLQLELKAEERAYLTLGRVGFAGGGYGYLAGELASYPPIPEAQLSITIPGAVFPAFSNASFPTVPPALATPDEPLVMTPEGALTWEPYTPAEGVSFVTFRVGPVEFSTKPYAIASCVAVDDGSFTFPAPTQTELLEVDAEYTGVVSGLRRSVYRVESSGEAALVLGIGFDPTGPLLSK